MSYHVYCIDGYGICLDDLPDFDMKELRKIANLGDDITQSKFEDCVHDEIFYEEEYESDLTCDYGISALMSDVISNVYDLDFTPCRDYNGVQYLLYQPSYPWVIKANCKIDVTQNVIEYCINGILKPVMDHEVKCDYYTVENGG